jgi:hypothetical protein
MTQTHIDTRVEQPRPLFKRGDLVVYEGNAARKQVILCDGSDSVGGFGGTVIHDEYSEEYTKYSDTGLGYYGSWNKEAFKTFIGTLTITAR